MDRSLSATIDAMLPLIPSEGVALKDELSAFKETIFLELPEKQRELWMQAMHILGRHFPNGDEHDLNDWQHRVALVWRGEASNNG